MSSLPEVVMITARMARCGTLPSLQLLYLESSDLAQREVALALPNLALDLHGKTGKEK
jgi:hypothetical protein